jgi:hypothetical protein
MREKNYSFVSHVAIIADNSLLVKHLSSHVFSKYLTVTNITFKVSIVFVHAVCFNNPGRK